MSRHRDLVPVPDRVGPAVVAVVGVTHPADLRPADPAEVRQVARPRVDLPPAGAAAPHLMGQVDLRPADRAGKRPADRAEVRLVDLHLVVPVAPGLMDRVDLPLVGLVDLAARVIRVDRARLVGRVIQAAPEHTSRADLEALVARAVPVAPAVREPTSLVDLVAPVDRAALAVRVGLARTDLVDRRLEHLADRHRRRIDPPARTTEVVLSGAVPPTHHMASAHPTTVRRHHPHSAGSAGTTVLLPVGLRRTGTDRHLRVAGMVHRLLAVGTVPGVARRST